MTREEKIDIYNEVDNFVEENEGEVTHTKIARHFFELGRNNAIDKACEWLTRELCYTARGFNLFNNKTVTDEFVESFKQAMKGE